MLYATDDGVQWSFVTLTANRKTRTLEGSHQNLARGWNRLNLRLKRQFPGFAFVRVWELHKKRAFHAHYLWRALPSKRWVKDNAAACGMGFMADIAVLDMNERAKSVFYVAKYMTKEGVDFPKDIRRISCSRNFPNKAKEESTQDWRVLGTTLEEYDAWTLAWENRLDLYDVNEDRILTVDDFQEDGGYVGTN
jgi:hypothetical protein